MFKLFVHRRSLTRRQALKAGAAAAAVVSLRPAVPALADGDDLVFELDLDGVLERGGGARAAGGWQTTPVLRAPRRFDLVGLHWARGSHAEAQLRARRDGGRWTRWVTLHPTGDHGPDRGPLPTGTDPAYTGAADEFQLRLRGVPRGLRGRFVRAQPAAKLATRLSRRLRGRAAQAGRPAGDHPAQRVGRRQRPAARARELRSGPARVRPSHRDGQRLPARGVGRDRARHRALPPQLERLERHRLPVPGRQVRPDLRGPRGRHRPARRRGPGAGLEQHVDRHRVPGRLHRDRPDARGHGCAGAPDRLEAVGPRRADPGRGDGRLGRRPDQPLPGGHAGHLPAHLRPSRRQQHELPGRRALHPARPAAGRRRAVRGPGPGTDRLRAAGGARRHPDRRVGLPALRRRLVGCGGRGSPSSSCPRPPAPPRGRSPPPRPAPTAAGAPPSRCPAAAACARPSPATRPARRSPRRRAMSPCWRG